MKKLLIVVLCVLSINILNARKRVVSLSADNASSPTAGMLRYYINNAQDGDTITFSVNTVNLVKELDIYDQSIVIEGSSMGKVTLDVNSLDRVFNISSYSSSTIVLIKNLIIQNGKITDDSAYGGGMYLFVSAGNVEIDNCIFQNNEVNASSDGQGGAVRNMNGVFKNCYFLNNKVTGSAYSNTGGGVCAIGGTFINCVFSGNRARFGGGFYGSLSSTSMYNCTIAKNECDATDGGGGISIDGCKIVNSIIYENLANGLQNNINTNGSLFTINHCAMENENILVGTNGNTGLTSSPFKNGESADSLSLAIGSACINIGTNDFAVTNQIDILSNARIYDGTIDLGAYEFGSTPPDVGLNSAKKDESFLLYPNPSNGNFNISTENESNKSLVMKNITGKTVYTATYSENEFEANTNLANGFYFVELNIDNKVLVNKMIIKK